MCVCVCVCVHACVCACMCVCASIHCTNLSGCLARLCVVGVVVVNMVHGGAGVAAGVLCVIGACRAVRVHRSWGAVGTAAVVEAVILPTQKQKFH